MQKTVRICDLCTEATLAVPDASCSICGNDTCATHSTKHMLCVHPCDQEESGVRRGITFFICVHCCRLANSGSAAVRVANVLYDVLMRTKADLLKEMTAVVAAVALEKT